MSTGGFDADALYGPDAVAQLEALVGVWKRPRERLPDLDTAALFDAIRSKYRDWRRNEDRQLDYDLQALLAVARAVHESWFTPKQLSSLDEWLGEVGDAEGSEGGGRNDEGGEEDWTEGFGDDKQIEGAVKKGLGASDACILREPEQRTISIDYKGGDYGDGVHNGTLVICDEEIAIYDDQKPGVKQVWLGELPGDYVRLAVILEEEDWEERPAD
eukprot:TRINITY_DN1629_c0_g1_i1.p2 TRINITY_DN1629_c0_g1~~TRINITY_DN1629_c0_g1_i1.p2  ORF type:complete len:246 (+),score=83.10 TRINITY_DN1629_c0_g1_i1:94-738(+)